MEVQQDFKELLRLLNVHHVEYVIVGAHALAYHGAPRYTGDMDVYVRPCAENARRIVAALEGFGFGAVGLTEADFLMPDRVIQLGSPPVRIDLVTSITGVSWEEVFANKVEGKYGEISVCYIGRSEFVANKRACGRRKDLADLEALGED
jgi:hypothetical protein